MKTLVMNIGSSSVKYDVFDIKKGSEKIILKGEFEKLRTKGQFSDSIKKIIKILENKKITADAIGHRVVHGGTIEKAQKINSALIKKLEKVAELAPLHDFPEIKGIKICQKLSKLPQVAVFDTAFHQSMPEKAYTYALPYKIAEKYNIRRYGFHGTSHKYVATEACGILKKNINQQKIITCHLGNGCSIAAIKNGKSIDTSMGFTPLEGLVMGTRSGDIDPAIITFLMEKGHYKIKEINNMLNKRSGLLGISGISNDIRALLKPKTKNKKNRRAKLAIDVFCYRAAKYIGAYHAILGGTDILVFTAGIGENNAAIRREISGDVNHLKIKKVMVVKTDEAKMIAREVKEVLGKR